MLVTGGAGFIGSHVVDLLLSRGARVRVLDNMSTGRDRNLVESGSRIEFHLADIRDERAIERAVGEGDDQVSHILHLGALGSVPRSFAAPLDTHEVNATGSLLLLDRVRRVATEAAPIRVVLTSSSSVYGNPPGVAPRCESDPLSPLSPYAASKVAMEGYGRAFLEPGRVETTVLRPFNVYGPRQDPRSQYAAVVPNFFLACLEGRPLSIHGDGEQRRDFTYVEDVARAYLLAAERDEAVGQVFNVGAGCANSVNELASSIVQSCGCSANQIVHGEGRRGDVRFSQADTSRARELLGWVPEVSLSEGIERLAASWKAGREEAIVAAPPRES